MVRFIDISGPVVADTFYVNDVLSARDTTISLPEITPMTADVQAMGTLSLPIWQLIENMELAVTKIGVDIGLRNMICVKPTPMEARFVQTVTDANGNTRNVGCKAFMRGISNKIPGTGISVGEASENECGFTILSYRLVVDGEEYHNINRLAGKIVVAGVDLSDYLNML